jgi:cysteine desulfurase family protein (TIGR01976 family)
VVRRIPLKLEDCTLDLDAFERLLSNRTRLVAVGYASNGVGTVNDVARVVQRAHAVGALVWIDAVHYAPHGVLDVAALDADFLVCSAYKFFGPHLGILWGKAHLLEAIAAHQVRPAPRTAPEKFETGTKNHECLAGLVETLAYLRELGRRAGGGGAKTPREELVLAQRAIQSYEARLGAALREGLASVPGLRVYGIMDPRRASERVPTFAFNLAGRSAPEVSRRLGERGIYTWAGNYYALTLMQCLGLEGQGGAVRVGAVHYNTLSEVERLVAELRTLSG